jgi:thiamine biosynthesis protein ThiC
MTTIDLIELKKEKEALQKVVKAAVETFIDRVGHIPKISVYKEVRETKTMCSTFTSEGELQVTISINL